MCVCVCVCVCVCIYIYIYTHTHIYIYIFFFVFKFCSGLGSIGFRAPSLGGEEEPGEQDETREGKRRA